VREEDMLPSLVYVLLALRTRASSRCEEVHYVETHRLGFRGFGCGLELRLTKSQAVAFIE